MYIIRTDLSIVVYLHTLISASFFYLPNWLEIVIILPIFSFWFRWLIDPPRKSRMWASGCATTRGVAPTTCTGSTVTWQWLGQSLFAVSGIIIKGTYSFNWGDVVVLPVIIIMLSNCSDSTPVVVMVTLASLTQVHMRQPKTFFFPDKKNLILPISNILYSFTHGTQFCRSWHGCSTQSKEWVHPDHEGGHCTS